MDGNLMSSYKAERVLRLPHSLAGGSGSESRKREEEAVPFPLLFCIGGGGDVDWSLCVWVTNWVVVGLGVVG